MKKIFLNMLFAVVIFSVPANAENVIPVPATDAVEDGVVFIPNKKRRGPSDSEIRKALARKLYGKIRVVDIGEDVKVRVVNIAEDLRVRVVNISENSVGRWRFVNIAEDFKVRFVDIGEDITIRFVDIGEGPAN